MTIYGINPSFAGWTSRLPLFSDPIRRGKQFEIFREDGTPTGEPCSVGPDGWPNKGGEWHGVRLFGDQEGFMPLLALAAGSLVKLRQNQGNSAWVYWKGRDSFSEIENIKPLKPQFRGWHIPSGEAIQYFKPQVLRTLDWSMANKRTDWSKRRVLPSDPLQGSDRGMALELQIEAANLLNCNLWWNAPPRYELSVADYEARISEYLHVLKANCQKPPIIEYGNELWNTGFPVHQWLDNLPTEHLDTWHTNAAKEIETLWVASSRTFNDGDRWYMFVGGCLADGGFTLEKILSELSFLPDIAGPAFYVTPFRTPTRDDAKRWAQTGEVPTEDELMASMMSQLPNLSVRLNAHITTLKKHGVPYFGVYEAGQSMISNGRPWKAAALEAQKSEWMGDIYREIRSQLQAAGVDLACWYSAATDQTPGDARVDVFGLLESTLDKAAPPPKARAARGD